MKRKITNPFKMWGPWIGAIIILPLLSTIINLEEGTIENEHKGICPPHLEEIQIAAANRNSRCDNAFKGGVFTKEGQVVAGMMCKDGQMYSTFYPCISRFIPRLSLFMKINTHDYFMGLLNLLSISLSGFLVGWGFQRLVSKRN
jgi:hypothetical protein